MENGKVYRIGCTGSSLLTVILLLMITKFTLIPTLSWWVIFAPIWLPISLTFLMLILGLLFMR